MRVETAATCAAALALVMAALVVSRLADPVLAGAVTAFPALSLTLAMAVGLRGGSASSAHALTGLVRGLPCYLAFCLTVAITAPVAGAFAVALGLLAALAAAGPAWRGIPVTRPGLAHERVLSMSA